jgi:hypothetical protein
MSEPCNVIYMVDLEITYLIMYFYKSVKHETWVRIMPLWKIQNIHNTYLLFSSLFASKIVLKIVQVPLDHISTDGKFFFPPAPIMLAWKEGQLPCLIL